MKVRQMLPVSIAAILVLAAAVLLAACGGSSGSSSETSSEGESGAGGKKPSIAVVSIAGSEYFTTYNRGFEKASAELGLDVNLQNATAYEPNAVAQTINAVVATNPEYLIAPAIDSAALRQPLLAASERGIKVITYDTQVEEPDFVVTYVNANYHEYGELAGAELGRLVGGTGKVLLDSIVPGNEDLERLQEGFAEALPEGVTELPVQYGQGENSKAAAIVRATLTRYPDLAGVSAASAFGGEGTMAGLQEANKIGQVKAVLLSATKFAVAALENEEVQAIIAEPLETIGYKAVEAAYDDANGKEVPEEIRLPLCTITKENIDAPENAKCIQ